MTNCKTIAIANQKGGVGKTTTTLSLGVALSKLGNKVLLVDTDPQSDLTASMGWTESDKLNLNLSDLMESAIVCRDFSTEEAILHHKENIDLLPSSLDLSVTESNLFNAYSRERTLKDCLEQVKDKYDYILIDCMPSLGMMTINALTASDSVIIPVQSQYLAARGMTHLLQTIDRTQKRLNENLKIEGVLLTLNDNRTNLSKDINTFMRENYGKHIKIFNTQIPIAIKAAESTLQGESIFSYDKNNRVANAYLEFAKEVIGIEPRQIKKEPSFDR